MEPLEAQGWAPEQWRRGRGTCCGPGRREAPRYIQSLGVQRHTFAHSHTHTLSHTCGQGYTEFIWKTEFLLLKIVVF